MAEPITLILLVAASDATSAQTRAMARATREALDGAAVETLAMGPPDDGAALALAHDTHAAAIVEVVWSDAAHKHVTLRMHGATTGRWVERSFGFSAADAPAEQGRTLGFAIASIFSEALRGAVPRPADRAVQPGASIALSPPAQATPSATTPAPPAAPPSSSMPTVPAAPLGSPSPATDMTGRPPSSAGEPSTSAPISASKLALDLLALGATGTGGGAGGSAAVEWSAVPAMALRVGGGARTGVVDSAQASALAILTSVGIVATPWHATRSRPLELALRVDYVLSRFSLSHFDGDEPSPIERTRWLSGGAAALDARWLVTTAVDAVVGVGLQDDFETTEVNDKGAPAATIPALRFMGEGGIRVRF